MGSLWDLLSMKFCQKYPLLLRKYWANIDNVYCIKHVMLFKNKLHSCCYSKRKAFCSDTYVWICTCKKLLLSCIKENVLISNVKDIFRSFFHVKQRKWKKKFSFYEYFLWRPKVTPIKKNMLHTSTNIVLSFCKVYFFKYLPISKISLKQHFV